MRLHLQKHLLPVKEIQEKPFERKHAEFIEWELEGAEFRIESVDKDPGDDAEIKDPGDDINGDAVHADYLEREGPSGITFDVDEPVEQPECQHGEAGGQG